MRSGAILGYVSDTKKLVLSNLRGIMTTLTRLVKNAVTDDLWDLSAEILTELSRRDEVEYRISAVSDSVDKKVARLKTPPKRSVPDHTREF